MSTVHRTTIMSASNVINNDYIIGCFVQTCQFIFSLLFIKQNQGKVFCVLRYNQKSGDLIMWAKT